MVNAIALANGGVDAPHRILPDSPAWSEVNRVRFDDRLATLLTQPLAGAKARAVRWRQLVELAARVSESGTEDNAPMIAALAVIRSEREHIDVEVRAATARAIAGRRLGPGLLHLFAEEELRVAAPVLAAAAPDEADKPALIEAATGATRIFLRELWPAAAADVSDASRGADVARVDMQTTEAADESRRLADVVERLKAARQTIVEAETAAPERETEKARRDEPAEPVVDGFLEASPFDRDAVSMFRWESGSDGAIAWVDGAPRAALVGQSLMADRALAPLIGARDAFDGVVSRFPGLPGDWQLTGSPEYDPQSGHFLGYRGAALRQRADAATATASAQAPEFGVPLDPASLRELVHEIKTPLNAIIGFAEIIDGQYLGPAHRRYRERAAEIVTQARVLLEAIKDLDFAARLQGGREEGSPASLTDVLGSVRESLEAQAARRDVALSIELGADTAPCSTNADLSARLTERLVGALIDVMEPSDTLRIETVGHATHCELRIQRPDSLAAHAATKLFDPAFQLEQEGRALLGIGFALRLVRGLARVGGGDLTVDDTHFHLTLVRAA